MLVGSLGRILAGALTDRFGGRLMFTVLLVATSPFVLLVAFAGDQGSYGLMLLFGFFLGIGGTTFAVGIPFVNAWFEADRRGFATGVFGAGMGGTALSAFFTPRFVNWFGYNVTHVIIAVALVVVAFIVWSAMRDSPQWAPNTDPVVPKLVAAAKLPVTWQMSFLYAVAFGGFVAFSTYLPTYLKDVYYFDLTQAGTRTAGFAIAAVIARPVGGVLSDQVGPRAVAVTSFAGAAVHGDRGRRSSPRPRCPPAWRSWCSPRSSGSAPAACSPGSPRWHLANGSAAWPASSAPPVVSAGSSRRSSWARRTTRPTTATRSA